VDFSLWTWRQLVAMGYEARFVCGTHGRYGEGHAWVEFFEQSKCYLVEPQLRMVGDKFPRLTTLHYSPKLSVCWDGKDLKYFAHKSLEFRPSLYRLAPLATEWLLFWGWFWLKASVRLLYLMVRRFWRKATKNTSQGLRT
jgi:hypothetical protein